MGKKKHGGQGGDEGDDVETSEAAENNEALTAPEGAEGITQAGTEAAPLPSAEEQKETDKLMKSLGLASEAKPDRKQLKGEKFPNIGDRVHFVLPGGNTRGAHRPFDITSVQDQLRNTVNGIVLMEPGDSYRTDTHSFEANIPYGPEGNIGTWHYPEKAVKARQEANEVEDKAKA